MLGRWIAALCLLCATFAHEASAQALPSVCIESSSPLVLMELGEPRPLDLDADVALPSPMRDEELPWCASDDDPRCAPRHGSSAPSGAAGRVSPAIELHATQPDPIACTDYDFIPHAGLPPSAGAASRLERPPRCDRRAL